MPFSEVRTFNETRKRTSAEYVRFDPRFRLVLRMLNKEAVTVYKHWISEANGGKGFSIVCPNNYKEKIVICPIEAAVADLPRDDKERKNAYARRKFVINVLDRTPVTTCKSCNNVTPGVTNLASAQKQCISCHASLKDHDFAPLNKVKILEQGPRLFNDNLNPIADTQKADLGLDITDYDITFSTQGEGRERTISAIPQSPTPFQEEWLIDPETEEPQKLWDLEVLADPATVEEIELLLEGGTMDQLNALRGVEA